MYNRTTLNADRTFNVISKLNNIPEADGEHYLGNIYLTHYGRALLMIIIFE